MKPERKFGGGGQGASQVTVKRRHPLEGFKQEKQLLKAFPCCYVESRLEGSGYRRQLTESRGRQLKGERLVQQPAQKVPKECKRAACAEGLRAL